MRGFLSSHSQALESAAARFNTALARLRARMEPALKPVTDFVTRMVSGPEPDSERTIAGALRACRNAFIAMGAFSGVLNLLMLTGSLFMLQVYDRVLPSRSIPTLVALVVLIVFLFGFQALLDTIRGRLFGRIGVWLDERLSGRVFNISAALPLVRGRAAAATTPVRDLDDIRTFLSSPGPGALFDLPWMPLYIIICFAFHFWLGVAALAGGAILVALTLITEFMTREPGMRAREAGNIRSGLIESSRRNADVLRAMGMTGAIGKRFAGSNRDYLSAQQDVGDISGSLGALSRVLRMFLQSGVLAIGAVLVIYEQATPGIIIASAIIVSRALAPVETAIANWRGFVAARQAWARLDEMFVAVPERPEAMPLNPPRGELSIQSITVIPPGDRRVVIDEVNFKLAAGDGLGVIGLSASGKSSLARALVGVWPTARGKVRLDGAALEQWDPERLGAHIGYLPQEVELFAGTVAQNIARFAEQPDHKAVLKAAESAGVHQLVLNLPQGYDTEIGDGGRLLSAGQRQRVALARALYGDPFLVVLDEPNSNLDADGEHALTQAVAGIRARKGIVVIVAHRPSALAEVNLVLAMHQGRQQAFGPRDEILQKVLRAPPALKVVSETGKAGA